jgi:hypothetical protein
MPNAKFVLSLWLAAMLLVGLVCAAEDSDAKATGKFLRLVRDADDAPVALETAIVRYVRKGDRRSTATVDLVAAVHIADKSYYEQIDRALAGYDAVLYELVAPEKSRRPRPDDPPSNHPLTLLQNGMKDILGLEFQLKGINYTRKNMVHADMSPEEFAESMEKRGESLLSMMARVLGYAMTQQSESAHGSGGANLLLALFDNKSRSLALKRLVAEQFEESDGFTAALEGPNGSTLISGRNAVALDVLRKQLAAGKRKIAIFYGAAHMPNFQTRLRDDFGMTPTDTRWIVAWNMKP